MKASNAQKSELGASKKQDTKQSKEASKKKKEDEKLFNGEIDIGGMIKKGDIQFQATRVKANDKKKGQKFDGENKNKILERNSKKPQATTPSKAEKPNTDKLEKDLFKDLGGGNVSIDSDNEVK